MFSKRCLLVLILLFMANSIAVAQDSPSKQVLFGQATIQSAGGGADDSKFYFGARAGGIYQDRDDFQFGRLADDSNDSGIKFESEGKFSLMEWGPTFEVFGGMKINDKWSGEGRFSYSGFDKKGTYNLDNSENTPSFWVPFIDARTDDTFLKFGIVGQRFREVETRLNYDSDIVDFGGDAVYEWISTPRSEVDLIVGLAIANINQDFDYFVDGNFNGDRGADTFENLDEWFFGPRVGIRGNWSIDVGDFHSEKLRIFASVFLYLFGSSADLDARQNMVNLDCCGDEDVKVHDGEGAIVPRIDARAGFIYQFTKMVSMTASYSLGAWFNTARVVNPDIILKFIDGDDRWAGKAPVHIGREDLLTHSFTVGLQIDLPE